LRTTAGVPGVADPGRSRGPAWSLLRNTLRLERVRLVVIGLILALNAAGNVIGYRDTYPDEASRQQFAAAFQGNLALRLFYGIPRDLASVGGYVEFRVVGIVGVLAAGWAVFAAARALSGEEDAGRWELVLCGALTRPGATAVALAALLLECGTLWLVTAASLWLVGTIPGDLTTGQAMLVAAAVVLPGVLFAALGTLACQVAGSHRGAQAIGGALIAVALLLRIAADLASGAGWLRWLTPFGWAEELHPVTGARTWVMLLFSVGALLTGGAAVVIAARRDLGAGLAPRRAEPRSRDRLLGSTSRLAVRTELATLLVWVVATGTFAAILGAFAKSIADQASKIHLHAFTEVTTARGYLALSFVLFTLAVSLFATSHISGIRDDESSGRLETLFALPIARRSWLAGRLAVAAGSSIALGLLIGLLAWAGAASQSSGIGLGSLLEAGANCVPAALCFLGLGALLFATLPRLSGGGALAVVGVAFLWELLGALVGAPTWLLALSPFHHVAAVPQSAFDTQGALAMIAVAVVATVAAVEVFIRRDLQSG
jgi:ABC-2 type transport system permease protein